MAKHLFNNLEIYLTIACFGVIFAIASFLRSHNYWQVVAIAALVVVVLHGALFWVIRARQRSIRDALIEAMRPMLADRIKNKLSVVLLAAMEPNANVPRESIATAMEAAQEISVILDRLSLDSLRTWERRYSSIV